jgi:hypothetical protein
VPLPLSELRACARARSDQETNSTIVDETELDGYIQRGYLHLYEIMAENGSLDPLGAVLTFVSDGNEEQTVTPGNGEGVYKVLGLDVQAGTSYRRLEKLSLRARNIYDGTGAMFYRITGRSSTGDIKISFFPRPPSGKTFRLWYIPFPGEVQNDDFIDNTMFYEYVCLHAAIRMCTKADDFGKVQALNEELAACEEKIRWSLQTTNQGDTDTITSADWDVEREYPYYD